MTIGAISRSLSPLTESQSVVTRASQFRVPNTLALLLSVITIAACDQPVAPGPTVDGKYVLATIAGNALPLELDRFVDEFLGEKYTVIADTVEFAADGVGVWRSSGSVRTIATGDIVAVTGTMTFRWRRNGEVIVTDEFACGENCYPLLSSISWSFDGQSLSRAWSPGLWRYERVSGTGAP